MIIFIVLCNPNTFNSFFSLKTFAKEGRKKIKVEILEDLINDSEAMRENLKHVSENKKYL